MDELRKGLGDIPAEVADDIEDDDAASVHSLDQNDRAAIARVQLQVVPPPNLHRFFPVRY